MDYKNFFAGNAMPFGELGMAVLVILMVWALIWKGLALWKAARNGDTTWYVILLILNTVGILEIIYYFFIGKEKKEEVAK